MAIERHIHVATTAALLLLGCSGDRWIAPPVDTPGTVVAIREDGSADLAIAKGLADGERQFLEPGQELIWLGYGMSLEALNVQVGTPSNDRPSRGLRSDPALAQPTDVYGLTADGPFEWARLAEIPAWVLDLEVQYATPPPCPSFGPPSVVELSERPNAIALFRGTLVAARGSSAELAIIDTADPLLPVVAHPLGSIAPITALYAGQSSLFLGDEAGKLWRMGSTELDEAPLLLGTVSTSSCAVAAIDGSDDGTEVVAASRCRQVAVWSSASGRVSVVYDKDAPPSVTPVQVAWAGPSEAILLVGDGVGPPKILRLTGAANTEHLAPSYVPDSVARLAFGIRVAAHSVAVSSEQSLHCDGLGCGTKAPDAGPSDWEIDIVLPLLIDNVERMVAFDEGLVFAASSGKIGFFSPDRPSCRPSPTSGLGASVRGLDRENSKVAYSTDGTTIGLVELTE